MSAQNHSIAWHTFDGETSATPLIARLHHESNWSRFDTSASNSINQETTAIPSNVILGPQMENHGHLCIMTHSCRRTGCRRWKQWSCWFSTTNWAIWCEFCQWQWRKVIFITLTILLWLRKNKFFGDNDSGAGLLPPTIKEKVGKQHSNDMQLAWSNSGQNGRINSSILPYQTIVPQWLQGADIDLDLAMMVRGNTSFTPRRSPALAGTVLSDDPECG